MPTIHERQYDYVTYLAAHDLIEQVEQRCPKGTQTPSEQWKI